MTGLERARLSKRMTRDQLAAQSGVGYGTIRRFEVGEGGLSDASLFALAVALDVDPVEIVEPQPAKVA